MKEISTKNKQTKYSLKIPTTTDDPRKKKKQSKNDKYE